MNQINGRCLNISCYYNDHIFPLPPGKRTCPLCNFEIEIISQTTNAEVIKEKNLWYKDAFYKFPCVLAHEYYRLNKLYSENNVFGTFLQLKDVIESTIKFCLLAAASWGKSLNIDGREEAYEKYFVEENPSLGVWSRTIAPKIRAFYDKKDENRLPTPLWKLIDKLPKWEGNNNLTNWRNQWVGHGALRFDDDPEFQKTILEKIRAITEFYRTNSSSFEEIKIYSDGLELEGYEKARNLENERGTCELVIGNYRFDLTPFILHEEHGIFFFDEILDRQNSKFLSYPMGKTINQYYDYLSHMIDALGGAEKFRSAVIDSGIISNAENDFIAKLRCEGVDVEPAFITQWIDDAIQKHTKGVFLLEMERGCGKTFYTQKINCRFRNPWIINEELDVRTYHISRAQIGGMNEFTSGISSEWNQCFESYMSRWVVNLEQGNNESENAERLVCFLNKWKEITASSEQRLYKSKIMLVLDGLDEICEDNEAIWSFIPSPDRLPDGVYILLTGRNTLTDKLPSKYIDKVHSLVLSEPVFRIDSASREYRDFLINYLHKRKLPLVLGNQEEELISLAEGKMLGLCMLADLSFIDKSLINNSINLHDGLRNIVFCFLSTLERAYGEAKRYQFQLLLSILSVVACYEPLSLREIADLLTMTSIKIELLEQLSDLAPIITVERLSMIKNDEFYDANRYHFLNEEIEKFVKEYLGEKLQIYVYDILKLMKSSIESKSPFLVKGVLAIASQNTEIEKNVSTQKILGADFYCKLYIFLREYIMNADEISAVEWKYYLLAMKSICNAWVLLDEESKRILFKTYIDSFLECNKYGSPTDFERKNPAYFSSLKSDAETMIHQCNIYIDNDLDRNNYLACLYSFLASCNRVLHETEDSKRNQKIALSYVMNNSKVESNNTLRILGRIYHDYGVHIFEFYKNNKSKYREAVDLLGKVVKIDEKLKMNGIEIESEEYFTHILSYASALDEIGEHDSAGKYFEDCIAQIDKLISEKKGGQIVSSVLQLYNYSLYHYIDCSSNKMIIRKLIEDFITYKNNYKHSIITKLGTYEYLIRILAFFGCFEIAFYKHHVEEASKAYKELYLDAVKYRSVGFKALSRGAYRINSKRLSNMNPK